jgi:hypothetical protein
MTVPGFISANLHTSLDGTRVINYAQWPASGTTRTRSSALSARG